MFGRPALIDGDTLFVGAYGDDDNGESSGSMYALDLVGESSGSGLQTTVIEYYYDPLYRLTDVTYTGEMNGNTSYTYNAVGSRTYYSTSITTTQTISYYYNLANQMTSSIDQGDVTTTYDWDDAGRLITTTVDTTVTRLYSYKKPMKSNVK